MLVWLHTTGLIAGNGALLFSWNPFILLALIGIAAVATYYIVRNLLSKEIVELKAALETADAARQRAEKEKERLASTLTDLETSGAQKKLPESEEIKKLHNRLAQKQEEIADLERQLASVFTDASPAPGDANKQIIAAKDAQIAELEQLLREAKTNAEQSSASVQSAEADQRDAADKALIEEQSLIIEEQKKNIAASEKMASLGMIIPAVAHEIKNPLGAINNAVSNMKYRLPQALEVLPEIFEGLDENSRSIFGEALRDMAEPRAPLSAKDKRKLVRKLERQLEDYDLEDPDTIANTIVLVGGPETYERYVGWASDPKKLPLLEALESIATTWRQLHAIESSVGVAIGITKSLGLYARKDDDQPEEFDVRDNLNLVVGLYEAHMVKKRIEVQTEFEEAPMLYGFPQSLLQVWTNIMMNAADALELKIKEMENKGEDYAPVITLKVAPENGTVVTRIIDNGPGVPEAIQQRIFEELFTTKEKGKGTGLGLSISKEIVAKHGGKICLESQPGHTEFIVRLPVENDLKRNNHPTSAQA